MAVVYDQIGVKISAKDEASAILNKVDEKVRGLEKSFSLLNPTILGVGVGFTGLVAIATKAITEFAEAELGLKKLNDALKTGGVFSEAYSEHLQQVAQSLQDVTRFSDDAVIEAQQLLVTFGLYGETLDSATRAAADLAETFDKDLAGAARAIAKAVEGDVTALKRYGISIDESIPKSERFAAAIKVINDRMGGRAAAGGDTIIGAFTQAKNAVSNLFETFGGLISQTGVLQSVFKSTTETIKEFYLALGGGTKLEQLKSQLNALAKQQAEIDQGFSPNKELISAALTDQMIKLQKEIFKLTGEQKKSTDEATKKFKLDQEQLKAADLMIAKQKELDKLAKEAAAAAKAAAKQAAKDLEDLNQSKLEFFQEQNRKSEVAPLEQAIQSKDLELIKQERENILLKRQNLDIFQTANQKELDAQKAAYDLFTKQIDRADETIRELKKIQADKIVDGRNNALTGTANAIGTVSSGNVSSIIGAGVSAGASSGAFGASAAASAGPWGLVAAAIVSLISSADKLPGLITNGIRDLIKGLIEGMPKLFKFLATDFIEIVMTELIPALVQSITRSITNAMTIAINSLITVIKNIPKLITGAAKGLFDGAVSAIKDVGSAIGSIFGGGSGPTPEQKAAKVFDQLEGLFKELTSSLRATVRDILKQFNTPDQNKASANNNIKNLEKIQNVLQSFYKTFARSGDTETAAKLAEQIAANQQAQIKNYQEIFNIENARIDSIIAGEKALFDTRIEEQNAIKSSALQLIDQLKGFKATAVDAFKAVREAITGATLSPEANVDRLRDAFNNAGTPEEKAKAAQAFAGGLQGQFGSIQNLAASGAITGEEFARQRDEILKQLTEAEASTVSEFDRLINAQQAIVDRADQQIKLLQTGFDRFVAQMEAQRKELKDYFVQQLQRLDELNLNVKNTNSGGWNPANYSQNIGNQRGIMSRYGVR
jgi:hypothetical protein